MQIINNTSELALLDAVRPHPKNPRQGDTGAIHESIQANGFYGAIIAQKSTGFILAGNHRWQAARQAGATEIPVTWVDVDDDHALRILLADNRTNDLASYDDNALAELLREIHEAHGNLIGTGYDGDDLDQLLTDLNDQQLTTQEPSTPTPPTQPITQQGDTWQLGRHVLVCGDTTNPETIAQATHKHKIRTVIFDPPWDATELIQNHQLPPADDYLVFGDCMHPVARNVNLPVPWRFTFVWDTVTRWMVPGRPLLAHKSCDWFSTTGEYDHDAYKDPRHVDDAPIRGSNKRGDYELTPDPRGKSLTSIFRSPITDESHGVPHAKPVLWLALLIGNCTRGAVLDPFAGSGATLLACEQIDRDWCGIELEPSHCDVIVQRWEEATGQKATRTPANT